MSRISTLLFWYNQQNFNFPWRINQHPYNIWISEIMLQQTQVEAVIPYYIKWINKYPTINDLEKASIDDLLLLWQGLGYYKRVHYILKTAQIIIKDYMGIFPHKYSELIKLPGVGDYTASMILSISFSDNGHIPIDGNIKRIMSRLYVLSLKSGHLKNYKRYAAKYISPDNPGDSIQALMDLGREICKPQNPQCDDCPINSYCIANHTNRTNHFPVIIKKKTVPHYQISVGLIWHKNRFIISQRNTNKLLGGLWELPGGKRKNTETALQCLKREIKEELDIEIMKIQLIGMIKHQYSHMKLSITLFECKYKSGDAKPLASQKIKWINYNHKKEFAFPRATHKLFQIYEVNKCK